MKRSGRRKNKMLYALHKEMKIRASPKENAICPICNKEVIAKCGEINIWHWCHKSIADCDSFAEPEGEWHLKWKSYFPEECQEVIITEEDLLEGENPIKEHSTHDIDTKHRADIRTKNKLVIELQNSPISIKDIQEREEFYEKMIWILNGETLGKNISFYKKHFGWNTRTWKLATKRIFIDEGKDFLIFLNFENKTYTKYSKVAFIIDKGGKPF
jgi:competence protein CoiA